MLLINIGCGNVYHPSWINLDLVSSSPNVISWDFRHGIPYDSNALNVCYSSHLIEHFTQSEAKKLLAECLRVLSSGGIIRLAVPDLEAIAKNYLLVLEQAVMGELNAESNYDWMMLELYDQTVRNFTGGGMGQYLSKSNIQNKDFILSRIGTEAENYWTRKKNKEDFLTKVKSQKPAWLIKQLRVAIAKFFVALIAGNESARAFEEGIFRTSGEVHQWMYDRFSLQRMLEQCGFVDIRICKADESSIPDFNSFGLDMIEGKVRKPDSLFMEGFKP